MEYQHRPENPAKVFLRRYRALVIQRDSLQRSIDEAYDRATSSTGRLREVKVSSSGAYDRMAEDVARIVDETAQLEKVRAETERALGEILRAIKSVPDEMQRAVLMLRYVEGLGWIEIAEKIHYEISNTYIMHGRALWNVRKWMEEKNNVDGRS